MMMEVAGGTPSKAQGRRRAARDEDGHRFRLRARSRSSPASRSRRSRSAPRCEALGFAVEGKGATVKVTRAELAARRAWRRRSRRGGRAHRRPRQGAVGADAALARRGACRAHRDPAPRAPGAPHAGRRAASSRPSPGRSSRAPPRAHFGGGQDALELANPISSEMSSMRPSLLPGLLAAVQRNRNRGFADLGLFEVGQAYRGDAPKDQFIAASGVRAGAAALTGAGRHWAGSAPGSRPLRRQGRRGRAAGRARLRCRARRR